MTKVPDAEPAPPTLESGSDGRRDSIGFEVALTAQMLVAFVGIPALLVAEFVASIPCGSRPEDDPCPIPSSIWMEYLPHGVFVALSIAAVVLALRWRARRRSRSTSTWWIPLLGLAVTAAACAGALSLSTALFT